MRRYSENEIMHRLKNGLTFRAHAPFGRKPSNEVPFRAIVEAAGIPGVKAGRGRLTRKRFVKLVMSTGNQRRDAEYLAFAVHHIGVSYRDCLQRTMVPAILHADEVVDDIVTGKIVYVGE